jgi:hypothetical protein
MIVRRTAPASLVAVILLGLALHAAQADDSHLETLEAESPFAEVSSTEGVVLVDLYADW